MPHGNITSRVKKNASRLADLAKRTARRVKEKVTSRFGGVGGRAKSEPIMSTVAANQEASAQQQIAALREKKTESQLKAGKQAEFAQKNVENIQSMIEGGPIIGGGGTVVGRLGSTIGRRVGDKGLKLVVGRIEATGLTAHAVQMNTKNVGLIKSAAAKIVGAINWKTALAAGLALNVVMDLLQLSYGGKNIGRFVGQEEALQTIDFGLSQAVRSGNQEAYLLAKDAKEELLQEQAYWNSLESMTPFENFAKGLDDFRDASIVSSKVWDLLAEDMVMTTLVENDEAKIFEIRRKQKEDEAAREVDNFNERQLITFARIRLLNEEIRGEIDRERRKVLEEEAAFHEKNRAKQRKEAEEDRVAVAKFWLTYAKQKQKLADDSRPSKLNFGII